MSTEHRRKANPTAAELINGEVVRARVRRDAPPPALAELREKRVSATEQPPERARRVRPCSLCGELIMKKTWMVWDPVEQVARHRDCGQPATWVPANQRLTLEQRRALADDPSAGVPVSAERKSR